MKNFEAMGKGKKGSKKGNYKKEYERKQTEMKPAYRKEKAEKPAPKKSTKNEMEKSEKNTGYYGNKTVGKTESKFKAGASRNGYKPNGGYRENKNIVTKSDNGKTHREFNGQSKKSQAKKPAPKNVLNQIVQKEEKRYIVQPTFTNSGIPCVWDYNDGERIRLVMKADSSMKNAVYINSDSESPFHALIPITRSNLIIDYFVNRKALFIYKVISNSIKVKDSQSKSGEEPVIIIPYNQWSATAGWKVEPFESIANIVNIIDKVIAKDDILEKGYYTKKETTNAAQNHDEMK